MRTRFEGFWRAGRFYPAIAGGQEVIGSARIRIEPDTKNFGATVGKQVEGGLLPSLKRIGLAIGGAFAIRGAFNFVKEGVTALGELQRIGAQTDAVLKSTGNAANTTNKEIVALAEGVEKLTGIEQETVREGANLLLTFTNIRNEAGRGNDIFNQATKTLVDMSTALGQDAKSSAIQLGKALNDPIKGVTALQRVGVSFTAAQRDQIEALVEAGDVMGAQKLILAELNKEFGGSAEAFGKTLPGQLAKFKNAVGDVQEQVAAALLPALQGLLPALGDVATALGPAIGQIATSIAPVISTLAEGFAALLPSLFPIVEVIGTTLTGVLAALLPAILPVIEALAGALLPVLEAIAPSIVILAETVGQLLVALTPLIPPLVQLALVGLQPTITLMTVLAKIIQAVVVPVLNFIVPVVSAVIGAFANMGGALGVLRGIVVGAWAVIRGAFNLARSVIGSVVGAIRGVLQSLAGPFNAIKGFATGAWNAVVGAFQRAFDRIKGIVRRIKDSFCNLPFVPCSPIPLVEDAKAAVAGVEAAFRAMQIPAVRATIGADSPTVTASISPAGATARAGASFASAGFARAGGVTVSREGVTINVAGSLVTEQQLDSRIADALVRIRRLNGNVTQVRP